MECSMAVRWIKGVSQPKGKEKGRELGLAESCQDWALQPQLGWIGRVGYILLMINQILAALRTRAILRPIYRLCRHTPVNYFCSSKDDKEKEAGETVISLGKQDIDMMKKFLKGSNIPLNETEQGQGEEFFQGQEVRLSLKLLQIDTVEQLKPFIAQYIKKKPEQGKDPNELTRCKFFILLKYINLQGSILSKEISGLFKDISKNIQHLDQETFTVLLRLIANDKQAILLFHHLSPNVPLSLAPSHNNSELLCLLLMIYPQAKEDVYLHYYLKPTKEIAQSQPKRMVYDPVNLIHILSHYFYYDDVHKLMEHTMQTTTVEDITVLPEESVRTDEDLKGRKAEALIYAANHELVEIYGKYLSKEYFNFAQFGLKEAVQLLKSLSLSQKATTCQKYHSNMRECCLELIHILLGKKQAFISGEDDQLVENEHFKAIAQILASYIRWKQPFLPKEHIIPLARSVFDGESPWRAKFDMYPPHELFSIIVSYKASKDFLMNNQIEVDQRGITLAAMLDSFKHMAGQAEPIQLFYVCLFAHHLKALPYIKSAAVLRGLKEFSSSKDLNVGMRQQLKKVVAALEEQSALQ